MFRYLIAYAFFSLYCNFEGHFIVNAIRAFLSIVPIFVTFLYRNNLLPRYLL